MNDKTEVRLVIYTKIFFITVFLVPLAIYSFTEIDMGLIKYGMPVIVGIIVILECISTIGTYGFNDE
jgi:hypothetical protein